MLPATALLVVFEFTPLLARVLAHSQNPVLMLFNFYFKLSNVKGKCLENSVATWVAYFKSKLIHSK